MLKVVKYEWLRRWKLFLAGIVTFLAANFSLISNLMRDFDSPRTITGILIGLCFALSIVLFIDHIGRLYRTLFSEEGYLELSLPLGGYRFLGGKLLAVALECIGLMFLIGMTFYLDTMYLMKVKGYPIIFDIDLSRGIDIVQGLLMLLSIYLTFLTIVYLSMTLSRTLFASFKRGKLIAFGCFLGISWGLGKIEQLLEPVGRPADQLPDLLYNGLDWLLALGIMAALFLGTSYLLDKKVNL